MLLVLVIRVLIPKIVDFSGEKYRGSRITTNIHFIRLQEDSELKFVLIIKFWDDILS